MSQVSVGSVIIIELQTSRLSRKDQPCVLVSFFFIERGSQFPGATDIVRVDPFRTNVTQRQMRAAFDARFWFRYFWAVLSHFQLHTSIIWVVESIGSIRWIRSICDPLYQMT